MENLRNVGIDSGVAEKPQYVKHHISKKTRDAIFIIIMLAYPILQFVITWSFVNINSIIMAFQDVQGEFTFNNFKVIFDDIFNVNGTVQNHTGVSFLNDRTVILLNSFGFALVTIFISLPLSLLFAYFLHKKMPAANVFRFIFFLPNIIPVAALTFAFVTGFNTDFGGYFAKIFGIDQDLLTHYPTNQILVYGYCIWAGLGYNIILISGAIGRIPKELFESAELDHAGYFKEFIHVVIPCIWPTIVTLVVLGMTNVLTLYLQPYMLDSFGIGRYGTGTIAWNIFDAAQHQNKLNLRRASAYGLFFSLLWAPMIMLVRHFLSKKFEGVDY